MSPRLASDLIPVVVIIVIAFTVAAYGYMVQHPLKAWQRRKLTRAPFRVRFRARMHEIFGGSNGYFQCDGAPLSDEDADLLGAYERDFVRGRYAREPRKARRHS